MTITQLPRSIPNGFKIAQIRDPLGIDIQHKVSPALLIDRVAGMNSVWIHNNQSSGTDLQLIVSIEKRADTLSNWARSVVCVNNEGERYGGDDWHGL